MPATDDEPTVVYICPRCLTAAGEPGQCPDCRVERVCCMPGEADDPLRKPLMDDDGRLLTQAPGWWLQRIAEHLVRRHVRGRTDQSRD